MKRFLKYLGILLFSIVVITGCGNDKKNEKINETKNVLFENAVKNTTKLENYKVKFNMLISIKALNGQKQEADADIIFDFYSKDIAKFVVKSGNQEILSYIEKNDDLYKVYMQKDNKWYYQTTKDYFYYNVAEYLGNIFSDIKKIEKVSDDEYNITIDKNKLKEIKLLQDSENTISMISGDLVVNTKIKDGYIESIVFDLGNGVMDYFKRNGIETVNWILKLEFSDINSIEEIIVPKNVKDEATLTTEDIDIKVN